MTRQNYFDKADAKYLMSISFVGDPFIYRKSQYLLTVITYNNIITELLYE